MNTELNLRIQ
jgi:chromosome segregation ATPase